MRVKERQERNSLTEFLRRRRIRPRAGTTLVELVVAMLVFGIMMTMVVGVLSPAARLFLRMEGLQRAEVILDNTIQELYGIAEEASGYVKIYPAGTADVTDRTGGDTGDVLEFVNPDKYVMLVSTGGCEKTAIAVGPTTLHTEAAVAPGRLLKRYYSTDSAGTDRYYYNDALGNPIARALATVFADEYYMGNDLKITFSYPAGISVGDKVPYLNAHVELCDSAGRTVVQEDVVLDLRYEAERKDALTAVSHAGP